MVALQQDSSIFFIIVNLCYHHFEPYAVYAQISPL